ncbi:MAG: VOC family protein [Candidatus Sericytochromatia bacterium]
MFKKLNHVQLCIPPNQEEKARDFYINILGLKEIEKTESLKKNGGFWLEIADIQLHIGIEEGQNKSKRHPAFEVEDLESLKKLLIQNNIQIKEDTPILNQNRFSFFDPFGNRIEVLEFINN